MFAFDTRKAELWFLGNLIALFAGPSIGFYFLEGRMQLVGIDKTRSVFLVALVLFLSIVANKQPRRASRNQLAGRPSGVLECKLLLR